MSLIPYKENKPWYSRKLDYMIQLLLEFATLGYIKFIKVDNTPILYIIYLISKSVCLKRYQKTSTLLEATYSH